LVEKPATAELLAIFQLLSCLLQSALHCVFDGLYQSPNKTTDLFVLD
jgi:hypothetical protein